MEVTKLPRSGAFFIVCLLFTATAAKAEAEYTLTLIDSAIESEGGGIIAGTTTTVPEPSSTVLCLFAACLCLRHRSLRTHEQNAQPGRPGIKFEVNG